MRPALRHQWGVTAVRFSWPHDGLSNQMTWKEIVAHREDLDRVVCGLPQCLYFVSAVCATATANVRALHGGFPGVGYWIVTPSPMPDCRLLLQHLNTNHVQATPKLLLQPYQKSERDLNNVLFKILKDNMSGCVPRLVQESWQHCHGSSKIENQVEPAVRICMIDPIIEQHLMTTVSELEALRFYTKLIHLK